MTKYSTYIEVEAPQKVSTSTIQAIDEALKKTEFKKVTTGYNRRARTINVRYNVNTEEPKEAIELGFQYLSRILEYAPRIGYKKLVAFRVEPCVDPVPKNKKSKRKTKNNKV